MSAFDIARAISTKLLNSPEKLTERYNDSDTELILVGLETLITVMVIIYTIIIAIEAWVIFHTVDGIWGKKLTWVQALSISLVANESMRWVKNVAASSR